MAAEQSETDNGVKKKGSARTKLIVIVLATVAITLAGVWVVRTYLYPKAFRPVELSAREQQVLDDKLERLDVGGISQSSQALDQPAALEPEQYRENEGQREISLTEKELNGLLAHNTDLASRLAVDLSDDLASAKLLIPMQEGFPVVGGKTIRIDAGLELAFANNRPVVVLRGVSVMGVPIPNSWLGNLKNIDLVQEFGGDSGFWNAFADGVESLQLSDGEIKIRLKE